MRVESSDGEKRCISVKRPPDPEPSLTSASDIYTQRVSSDCRGIFTSHVDRPSSLVRSDAGLAALLRDTSLNCSLDLLGIG
jgi:hypothetical protein